MMPPLQRPVSSGHASVPDAYYLQRLGAAAADSLRRTVRSELSGLIEEFVRRMPQALAEHEVRLSDRWEREAVHELRSQFGVIASRWTDIFVYAVDAHLVGSGAGTGAVSGANDDVVIGQAELQAEEHYGSLLAGLDERIEAIRQTLYVPVHVRALAPAGLIRALQDTADQLGWPLSQRRFLFARFEWEVIPRLGELYNRLMATLQAIGSTAEQALHSMATPAVAPRVDPVVDAATVSMLQTYAVDTQDLFYTDHTLAADLLALVENRSIPDLQPEQRHAPLQRMSLAGQFLNEAIDDPLVPAELRQRQAAVRLPLVKTALADASLFTSPNHPVGSLINELMLKSATARVTGNDEERRAAERLEQLLVHFELAPEFVRQAILTQQPIDEAQVQKFLESRRSQAKERRATVVRVVQRRVLEELSLSSFGRKLPPALQTFLHQCWGPLLMKRLLDHGPKDVEWSRDLELLDRLVALTEESAIDAEAIGEWRELLEQMTQRLVAAGMGAGRIEQGLASLRKLFRAA
ncbi:MAG TPA: DUF1631 family protein [Solimonas sp.]|nr:DUF1631 family protein [Solimonas sp.]